MRTLIGVLLSLVCASSFSAAAPQYSSRWVNGTEFKIGATDRWQVWVSLHADDDPHLFIYLINGTDHAVTFMPADVSITAVSGEETRPVHVFTPEEWKKKLGHRQYWKRFARAAGEGSGAEPTTTTMTGNYTEVGPEGVTTGHVEGQATQEPSAAEVAVVQAIRRQDLDRFAAKLKAEYDQLVADLLQNDTLDPGTAHGGTLYFKKTHPEKLQVNLKVDDALFAFEFAQPS
jgi:hypothetical protein